jgi:hypothetical protein
MTVAKYEERRSLQRNTHNWDHNIVTDLIKALKGNSLLNSPTHTRGEQ